MPFSNIIAHDSVIHLLKSAIVHERIPSAYLFTGLKGTGKSLVAFTLAKMINCESHINCDICENCLLMNRKTHPDFLTVSPEGTFIKIEQIHELQEKLALKPFKAQKRVVLIKDADRFNSESGNAFLKTLEEPPLDTLLILTTTDEDQILETVYSRCQKVSFPPLKKEHLRSIIQDKFNPDPDKIEFILNYSYGGVRSELITDAETMFNFRKTAVEILTGLKPANMVNNCQKLEELVAQNAQIFFLECAKNWFRDLTMAKLERTGNFHNPELISLVQDESDKFTNEQLEKCFDLTIETEKAIQLHASRQLALESLLIQLKQVIAGNIVI